jgi:hypothetical protein
MEIMSDPLPSKENKDYFLGPLEFVVGMDCSMCQITITIEFLSSQLKEVSISTRLEARGAMRESYIHPMASPIQMACSMSLIVETTEFKCSRKMANLFE